MCRQERCVREGSKAREARERVLVLCGVLREDERPHVPSIGSRVISESPERTASPAG